MDNTVSGIRYPWDSAPEHGEAIEVADGVLWMRLPLPMMLDHVNVYALDDGDGWTIIDTGFDSEKTRAIWQILFDGPLKGKPITRVIVTHHHPDHVGLAGWFQSEHGAALWTTRTAWLFARMLQLDEQAVPTQETLDFYRRAGMVEEVFKQRASERPFNFSDMVA
ncbi:MAG: MBL fold metallo-hydrolase, partial [Rhodobacteraceae bacterium]|nr:MBL fold metallo-hydrolase [Paracoccaceae bacterium]